MVKISGFTIARNAIQLDFPLEASIRSILPVCDEVIVNVGRSEDDTLELVRSIQDPRIRIIESEWDTTIRNRVLGVETARAMRACRHPWGIYIQADEVLHERGAQDLAAAIQRNDADARVEGLVVDYHHFYGDPGTTAVSKRWYRRETRAVRLDPALDIRPYLGAQGFRVGPELRRIRARLTPAEMFHYGWTRSAAALLGKRELDRTMYPWRVKKHHHKPLLPWIPGLRRFKGSHPAVAAAWVQARAHDPERRVAPYAFQFEHIRLYITAAIENLMGIRIFEYRNYELV